MHIWQSRCLKPYLWSQNALTRPIAHFSTYCTELKSFCQELFILLCTMRNLGPLLFSLHHGVTIVALNRYNATMFNHRSVPSRRTWIHDNLCDLTIKSDIGQHSQFLIFLQFLFFLGILPDFIFVFVLWTHFISILCLSSVLSFLSMVLLGDEKD